MDNIDFVEMKEGDLTEVLEIYNYYVKNSTATFHIKAIDEKELKNFVFINHQKYKSYIIKKSGKTCGYCLLTQYKKREAYGRTAEVSMYLKPEQRNKGIGCKAVSFLEKVARENNIKILIAGITAENRDSIRLFKKLKFFRCGHFKKVGEKFGKILDVVYYEKIL